jgi:hypothetical protein
MGHVTAPLAELTARARTLTSAGDLTGARAVLVDALDPVDTDPQRASPDSATAAALLARVLIALGDPHAARVWAGFAHAAEDRLHGPDDERTLAAAALHAAVLHRIGNHARAVQLYHDLAGQLATRFGADSARALAAEADLATAEHAAGHCTAARDRLADAWRRYGAAYGDADPNGIKMLARLGSMERECGLVTESQEHLALAQELCSRYLPADHPLARQAATLAREPASGRHVCGRVARPTDSGAPGVTPVHTPGVTRVRTRSVDHTETHDPTGGAYQQPLYRSDPQPPGEPAGRPAPPGVLPPVPGQRARETGAVEVPPSTRDRRLPVRVDRGEGRRSWQPLLLVAALVAAVAVAAAVVVALLSRGSGAPSAAASPAASPAAAPAPTVSSAPSLAPSSSPPRPSPSASAGPDAARRPQDLRLQDNRDSVSLTWRYPKGSEGPILISGGRNGQPQRAFQQLPAGTTSYIVYGLNEQLDYCFTVAIVYATDRIATSPQLCTARG